jgi:hypothetical protein
MTAGDRLSGTPVAHEIAVMYEIMDPKQIWHSERSACNSKQEGQPDNNKMAAHSNFSWTISISVALSNLCRESRDTSTFLIFAKGRYLDIWWMENKYDCPTSFCLGCLIQPNLRACRQVDNWSRAKSMSHGSRRPALTLSFSSLNKNRYGSLVVSKFKVVESNPRLDRRIEVPISHSWDFSANNWIWQIWVYDDWERSDLGEDDPIIKMSIIAQSLDF